jgi:hypothetical protein
MEYTANNNKKIHTYVRTYLPKYINTYIHAYTRTYTHTHTAKMAAEEKERKNDALETPVSPKRVEI